MIEHRRAISRRQLIAGVGVAAIGSGALVAVGASLMPRHTPDGEPSASTGPMLTGSFDSRWGAAATGWAISYPPGAEPGDPLPVLVSLHGYNGDHTGSFGNRLGLDLVQAQEVNAGAAPFAIASVDGGNSYWHARRSGLDPVRMLTEEFLPLLADRGLSIERIGLLGVSVGGFGALLLARTLGPSRVAAVVTLSGALWRQYGDAPAIAFDDEADFAAHTPFDRQAELDGIAVRIDCGLSDDYYPATRAYVDGFESAPTTSFEPGAHDLSYFRRMAPAQLRFVAEQLA